MGNVWLANVFHACKIFDNALSVKTVSGINILFIIISVFLQEMCFFGAVVLSCEFPSCETNHMVEYFSCYSLSPF